MENTFRVEEAPGLGLQRLCISAKKIQRGNEEEAKAWIAGFE